MVSPIDNLNISTMDPAYLEQLGQKNAGEKQLESARDFEAVFVQMSLKEMRPKMEGGLFNSGLAEEMFYEMMDAEVAKQIAHSDANFGIADELMKQNFAGSPIQTPLP